MWLVGSRGSFNSYLSQKVTASCESWRSLLLYQFLAWKKIPRPKFAYQTNLQAVATSPAAEVLPAGGVTGAQVLLSHHPLG